MNNPHPRFSDKVVVITGASAGIGAATARAFAREGAVVVLVARTQLPLETLAQEIVRAGGRALAVPADIGDSRAGDALIEHVAAKLGGIDVLVNNAGANHRGVVEERTGEELSQIVSVNLMAPILLSRASLVHMRRRGGGSIVNVASLAGRVPFPHEATYCATKAGLRAFSFALAEELAGSGIRVSVVSPGPVDTGFIMSDLEHVPDIVFSQPMSTADQVATLIVESALDGSRERTPSLMSACTTTLGYLFPTLRRSMTPLLERKGRAAKRGYMQRGR